MLFLGLLAEVILFSYVFNIIYVPSASMEPNIHTQSLHLSWALPHALGIGERTPKRGDIIVFCPDEGPALIKRVIGLPGEALEIKDGAVYIDGKVLEEPYLPVGTVTSTEGKQQKYKIPSGSVFVMGDNRSASLDSRYMDDPYIEISSIQSRFIF